MIDTNTSVSYYIITVVVFGMEMPSRKIVQAEG